MADGDIWGGREKLKQWRTNDSFQLQKVQKFLQKRVFQNLCRLKKESIAEKKETDSEQHFQVKMWTFSYVLLDQNLVTHAYMSDSN